MSAASRDRCGGQGLVAGRSLRPHPPAALAQHRPGQLSPAAAPLRQRQSRRSRRCPTSRSAGARQYRPAPREAIEQRSRRGAQGRRALPVPRFARLSRAARRNRRRAADPHRSRATPALAASPCVAHGRRAQRIGGGGQAGARFRRCAWPRQGFTVVSGLARGIDGAAHRGRACRATIGVIASGIDIAYPPQHAELQEQIARRRPADRRTAARHRAARQPFPEPQPHHRRARRRHAGGRGGAASPARSSPRGWRARRGARSWRSPAPRSMPARRAATS